MCALLCVQCVQVCIPVCILVYAGYIFQCILSTCSLIWWHVGTRHDTHTYAGTCHDMLPYVSISKIYTCVHPKYTPTYLCIQKVDPDVSIDVWFVVGSLGDMQAHVMTHTHMQAHVMTCCRTCVHTQYIYMCIQNRDVDSIEMREMYISQDLLCTSMYLSQHLLHSLMILECNTCNKRYLNTPLLHVRTVFR